MLVQRVMHNGNEVEDKNEYELRVEIKQGPAGWFQMWLKNKTTEENTSPFQSPKKNCLSERRRLSDVTYNHIFYKFCGESSSGYHEFNYCASEGSEWKSEHYIWLYDNDGSGNFDFYRVISCNFYHDEQGKHAIVQRLFLTN